MICRDGRVLMSQWDTVDTTRQTGRTQLLNLINLAREIIAAQPKRERDKCLATDTMTSHFVPVGCSCCPWPVITLLHTPSSEIPILASCNVEQCQIKRKTWSIAEFPKSSLIAQVWAAGKANGYQLKVFNLRFTQVRLSCQRKSKPTNWQFFFFYCCSIKHKKDD